MANTITDPRLAHTLSEFLSATKTTAVISYASLSFIETTDNIEYTVKNVLSDYIDDLKQYAKLTTMTQAQEIKYFYRPKLLASDIYGATELYHVFMLLNNICDVKDFTINPLYMLSKENMSDLLAKIYNNESSGIKTYNANHITTS
jgi:hypothetical protein